MLFFSLEFFIFLSVFVICIIVFKQYQRNIIIIFSIFFYSYWNIFFFPLIIFFCLIVFFLLKKNYPLILSIPIALMPLIYFKYSFFILNLINAASFLKYGYQNELPLAISFITFTAIAILIDRKNKSNNEYNVSNISEYILYFPHLIAGPILRLNQLIPQLKNKITFSKNNIKLGLILFGIGYIKKIYFADNIAVLIDPFFKNPELHDSQDIMKAFLLFPIQIYFDFSGYVDMALGISQLFGISLPQNFDKPYLSSSITEFWRRWHITLSNWFKDYIYIPLGGSKNGDLKTYFNLLLTMTVAGIWHGASLNFLLWGFLNGLILCFEKISNFHKPKYNLFKNLLICFIIFNLWIVFRISDFSIITIFFKILYSNFSSIIITENLLILIFVIASIIFQKIESYDNLINISKKINLLSIFLLLAVVILTGLSMSLGQSEKFIYFQF